MIYLIKSIFCNVLNVSCEMLKDVIRSIWTNIEVIFIRQIFDFSMLLSMFKNDQEWQSEDDSKMIINCFVFS
jgi:hypothetical protein